MYQLAKFGGFTSCGSKDTFKNVYLVSGTNTHRDVTDSVDHGIAKNTNT